MALFFYSHVLQCDGKKWGSLRSEMQLFFSFFFDWSEWFPPAAHLRKTDDNAVGVIYSDFTKMNMRSTFSSCKCGCAQKPPSFGWNYFCSIFWGEKKEISQNRLETLFTGECKLTASLLPWLLLLFVCGIKLHLIWYWASRGLAVGCSDTAAALWLIDTYHGYWTVFAVT